MKQETRSRKRFWFFMLHASCLVPLFLFISSCMPGGGEGFVALEVQNARAPEGFSTETLRAASDLQGFSLQAQASVDPLVVTEFRVTITAADLAEPITTEASADAEEIEILGIPVGRDRGILIEAFNGEGTVIRRRELTGIEIKGGVITPIKTSLNTIPLILNLKNNSTVLARHFSVQGFGEPAGRLTLEARSANQVIELNESPLGGELLVSPSVSSGLFEFAPPAFLLGKQTLTVTDLESGESSSIDIVVVEGEQRPGTRLSAASTAALNVGAALAEHDTGHFPALLHLLWEEAL